jgi:TatD DNase family protein
VSKKSDKELRNTPPPLPEPLAGTVFDSHCHFDSMAARAGAVLDRAWIDATVAQAASVGVTTVINVGCEVHEWDPALESVEHPDVYCALAVHPTAVGNLTDADYQRLEGLLAHDKVVAVGETGLDYYWDTTTPAQQQLHFRRHIDLAKRVGKPLMIHDRQAHDDVLRILAEEGAPEAGVVFHAFSGDAAMARTCAEAGYYLSFPGVVTFANAPELQEAAKVVPVDRILVETDAPFLTPHPFRGRPNAPYLIPHVIRQLSALRNITEIELCFTISDSGRRLYGMK